MTSIIARLDEADWIRRVRDDSDGRAWLIEGTAAGFTALSEHRLRLERALAPLFEDLDDDERHTIERAAAIIEARIARIAGATNPQAPAPHTTTAQKTALCTPAPQRGQS